MGLLQKIFGSDELQRQEKESIRGYFQTLTAYSPVFTTWNGALYESELVRSAIDARARHISKLKVEFTGSAQSKLTSTLKQKPNEWQTWAQFLYRASTILDINNTCFIVPVESEDGKTIGYTPILPKKTELVKDEDENLWLRYQFSGSKVGVIEFDRVICLTRHQYLNDFFGDSNRALDDTMKLIHLQNEGIEEAVKNSATYRFMAQANNFAKAGDLAKERERFTENNLKGNKSNGGILLFPNTYTNIQQITTKPYTVDAEQMKQIQTNVFNYYGVNEDVLQNKAYGDRWAAFYEGCVEVFSVQFSDAFTKALYTEREIANGNSVMATANRLQYLSNADKLNVSSQMADRGIMTRNEIREIWNLPPIDGGDEAIIRGEYYSANEKVEEAENEE